MPVLADLLRAFPLYYDVDPHPVPALRVRYAGTACQLVVEDDVLEMVPTGGTGERQRFVLNRLVEDTITGVRHRYNLGDLAEEINALDGQGYTAALLEDNYRAFADQPDTGPHLDDLWRLYPMLWLNQPLLPTRKQAEPGDLGWYTNQPIGNRGAAPLPVHREGLGAIGACVLADTRQETLGGTTDLAGVTNLLVLVLKPMAAALRLHGTYSEHLIQQLDLRTATEAWLDHWGDFYGLTRYPTELDDAYRRRLSLTTFRPRVNPTSLKKALIEGLGMTTASVLDTYPSPAAGINVFLGGGPAVASLFGTTVRAVIDAYRPAGILPQQNCTLLPPPDPAPRPQETLLSVERTYADLTTDTHTFTETGGWVLTVPRSIPAPAEGLGQIEFGEHHFG